MAILSISSEFGSGALDIGHEIERLLGYEYVPLRRILAEATQSGKKLHLFAGKKYSEDASRVWKGNDFVAFMALLQGVILDHAAKDNAVILARGSNLVLKEIPHALRLRVVCPLEQRIERIMTKDKVSHETARLLVKQADREIDCSIQQAYGKDRDDPEAYEIKFDTGIQSLGEIVEIARNLLAAKSSLKTAEAQRILQMRALAARMKAKVVTNPAFLISTLELEIIGDGILLRGAVHGKTPKQEIEKEVRAMAGRVPVVCELNVQTIQQRKKPQSKKHK